MFILVFQLFQFKGITLYPTWFFYLGCNFVTSLPFIFFFFSFPSDPLLSLYFFYCNISNYKLLGIGFTNDRRVAPYLNSLISLIYLVLNLSVFKFPSARLIKSWEETWYCVSYCSECFSLCLSSCYLFYLSKKSKYILSLIELYCRVRIYDFGVIHFPIWIVTYRHRSPSNSWEKVQWC